VSGGEDRTRLPADVVELLRDEPGLLAIADALKATQERRRRRAGIAGVLIAAAVVAAAAVIAVGLSHSRNGGDVIQRAAHAASGQHLNLVATVTGKQGRVEFEGNYLPASGQGRAVVHLSGFDKLAGGRVPQLRGLLDRFAIEYQRTLSSGRAQLAAATSERLWLRMTINGLRYEVALDRTTYRPVLIRVVPRGATSAVTLDITHFAVS
jgi:hypothetical protein